MKFYFLNLYLLTFNKLASSAPQQEIHNPEINDQFEKTTPASNLTTYKTTTADIPEVIDDNNEILDNEMETTTKSTDTSNTRQNIISNFYKIIKMPIIKLIATPKVNTVLKNIGTCVVNGVMEIISYYFPAPFIPLIASAAGMIIPFEPIVMLRRRMPVTSYRRAFKTAVNSFLNTFDAYKFDNYDEDPYMTRRFNRRFMNDDLKEEANKKDV